MHTFFGFRISDFFRPSGFGLRILYLSALFFSSAPLRAATNIVSDEEIPPLRPPREEIPPSFVEQYGHWLIAGAILALATFSALIWFLTRAKPVVAPPPAAQARAALEPLRSQPEDGVLLSQVSQILRRYVAAVFSMPQAELTSTEFCQTLTKLEQVGTELSTELTRFLNECDRRKFAPSSSAPPVLPPGALTRAYRLIDQTEARCAQLRQSAERETQPASSG